MKSYKSDTKLRAPKQPNKLSLPKINSENSCHVPISKSKRSHILMKSIKPVIDPLDSSSESDTPAIINKIVSSAYKKNNRAQIAVLSLNQNKQDRLKNPFMKQIFVGEQAVQKFYARYKHFDRQKEKQSFMKQHSPLTHIVQLLQYHNCAPRKLDLIKLKGSHAILDLRALGLGHGQMGPVVTELLKYMAQFDYVDLSSNNIDQIISQQMVESVSQCKIVNFSHNRIGRAACNKFAQIFQSPHTQLQELYLEDNSLMDNAGAIFLTNLADYNHLRVLNLSKNFMNSKFALTLKEYLLKDTCLEQLYLGWNQISDKSAKCIFQAMEKHETLKVLDYSWNSIGIFSSSALAQVFRVNVSLVHVDISFCDIDRHDTAILAEGLCNNHTIFGIHFEGNSGFVDNKGYIMQTQQYCKQYPLPIVRGIIRKIDSIHPCAVNNEFRSSSIRDVCWLCSSWQQLYIKVKINQHSQQCCIHLSCQQFKPIKMTQRQVSYDLHRMCPIGDLMYFFTYFTQQGEKTHFVSQQYPCIDFNKDIEFTLGDVSFVKHFQQLNYMNLQYAQDPLDENYEPNIHCLPRSYEANVNFHQKQPIQPIQPIQPVQQIQQKQAKKRIIKVKRKVLRENKLNMKFRQLDEQGAEQFISDRYDQDNDQEYLMKCIQFDIANSKINRLIKNSEQLQRFKVMMLGYYRDFKDVFYYLANTYPSVSGVFSIPELQFQRFLEQQKYITKRVTSAKIMLKMLTCLSANDDESSSPQKNRLESLKLFSRPQFLEFMIRLAIEKWCVILPKPKKSKQSIEGELKSSQKQKIHIPLPLLDGLQKTMKTLPKYADRVRASEWRKKQYLVIDIYTVIKGYEQFLYSLFAKYGINQKRLDKPKKLKGLITLEECKTMLIDTEIGKTRQVLKDIDYSFLDAKRLQIEDGITQYGLNFEQFCQFLARYSQILMLAPVSCPQHQLWLDQRNRQKLPLFIKFQAAIVSLYRNLPDLQTKKMNIIAVKGLFQHQRQILIQKINEMSIGYQTDLWTKVNQIDNTEITLHSLISALRQRYQNATFMKEQQIEEEQERWVIN